MNRSKRWVMSIAIGIAVGIVAALVVLAATWLVAFQPPKHVGATFVAALIAGVGGACLQAWFARESDTEELIKRLPSRFVFPMLMAVGGISALVIIFKSGTGYDEKKLCTIAVVVVVTVCLLCGTGYSLVVRLIAAQTDARWLAAQERMFKAATHAIKDKPEFKESAEKICFEVVDSLQVERETRRRRLPPPAPGRPD